MAPFEKVDFVGRWRLWFAISGIFLLLCIGAIAIRGMNFGIDFTGGAKFTASGVQGSPGTEEVLDPFVQKRLAHRFAPGARPVFDVESGILHGSPILVVMWGFK